MKHIGLITGSNTNHTITARDKVEININGRSYTGKQTEIKKEGNKEMIYLDGKLIDELPSSGLWSNYYPIWVNGNVNNINTVGQVDVTGDSGNIGTTGKVTVNGNSGSINTIGKVDVGGNVSGKISTVGKIITGKKL